MDTSEIYIKMCGCPEVQNGWGPVQGDFVCDLKYMAESRERNNLPLGLVFIYDSYVHEKLFSPKFLVWLPRQDQIMAMCFDEMEVRNFWPAGEAKPLWGLQTILYRLKEFSVMEPGISIVISGTIANSGTMEQLLLAFYMFTEHNLSWTEEKWNNAPT